MEAREGVRKEKSPLWGQRGFYGEKEDRVAFRMPIEKYHFVVYMSRYFFKITWRQP
jgi:hypothetical protein